MYQVEETVQETKHGGHEWTCRVRHNNDVFAHLPSPCILSACEKYITDASGLLSSLSRIVSEFACGQFTEHKLSQDALQIDKDAKEDRKIRRVTGRIPVERGFVEFSTEASQYDTTKLGVLPGAELGVLFGSHIRSHLSFDPNLRARGVKLSCICLGEHFPVVYAVITGAAHVYLYKQGVTHKGPCPLPRRFDRVNIDIQCTDGEYLNSVCFSLDNETYFGESILICIVNCTVVV